MLRLPRASFNKYSYTVIGVFNLSSPYIKFSDLKFHTVTQKRILQSLLTDIRELQLQIIYDEEHLENLEKVGGKLVAKAFSYYNESNKRILTALKITFWYYTGKIPDSILIDDEKDIDIFDPLGYK